MRISGIFVWLIIFCVNPVFPQPAPKRVQWHTTDFVIRAQDERTKAEIPATFQIKTVLSKKNFRGRSLVGKPYTFSLGQSDTVIIQTVSRGYYALEEVLFVPCDTCANFEHRALMEKVAEPKTVTERPDGVFHDLKVNDKIRLDNVYFDQSSYILRKESYPQLEKLLNTLNHYPKLVIEIAGHTDNVGDRRLNQLLSENRALVIANYLLQRGIPENRLQHQGYGDARPAAPNDTETNKKQNRRVEFTVLKL